MSRIRKILRFRGGVALQTPEQSGPWVREVFLGKTLPGGNLFWFKVILIGLLSCAYFIKSSPLQWTDTFHCCWKVLASNQKWRYLSCNYLVSDQYSGTVIPLLVNRHLLSCDSPLRAGFHPEPGSTGRTSWGQSRNIDWNTPSSHLYRQKSTALIQDSNDLIIKLQHSVMEVYANVRILWL